MVLASPVPVVQDERVEEIEIPIIDLTSNRANLTREVVKACEEFGFFKVVNHGVSMDVVKKMEAEVLNFFSLPSSEKQKSGPPNPLGYGIRTIGFNGDAGEVEYLLLHANINNSTSTRSMIRSIGAENQPLNFRSVMSEYTEAVEELACEILDTLGEGIGVSDREVFSRMIRDKDSDSLIRFNHYPENTNSTVGCGGGETDKKNKKKQKQVVAVAVEEEQQQQQQQQGMMIRSKVGFGEHSDPQIITLLRSNDVAGLQILSRTTSRASTVFGQDGPVWVPVSPDPNAFFVNVGDTLQALTNGRFKSVRHRALVNPHRSRLSLVYFGAPPLHARISPLPEMVTPLQPRLYRSFTWGEYKKAMYSLRLGYDRLKLFLRDDDDDADTDD